MLNCWVFVFNNFTFETQTSFLRGISIHFRNEEESGAFDSVFQQWKKEANVQGAALQVIIFMFDCLILLICK